MCCVSNKVRRPFNIWIDTVKWYSHYLSIVLLLGFHIRLIWHHHLITWNSNTEIASRPLASTPAICHCFENIPVRGRPLFFDFLGLDVWLYYHLSSLLVPNPNEFIQINRYINQRRVVSTRLAFGRLVWRACHCLNNIRVLTRLNTRIMGLFVNTHY